jgi:hypothetical protein
MLRSILALGFSFKVDAIHQQMGDFRQVCRYASSVCKYAYRLKKRLVNRYQVMHTEKFYDDG